MGDRDRAGPGDDPKTIDDPVMMVAPEGEVKECSEGIVAISKRLQASCQAGGKKLKQHNNE